MQTLRDLGVLRNQIGNEGLEAVIEYLPGQYTKRMLGSKDARAKYVMTVLAERQRPFIWEYFRPGTIPLPGERPYYDEVLPTSLTKSTSQLTKFSQKRRGPFQSEPVLRAFAIYFTCHGIQASIPFADPGKELRPIGALALAATAVSKTATFIAHHIANLYFRWNEDTICSRPEITYPTVATSLPRSGFP